MNLQNRKRPTDIENKLMVTKGERRGWGGGHKLRVLDKHIHTIITESLCYTPETNTTLLINSASIKKGKKKKKRPLYATTIGNLDMTLIFVTKLRNCLKWTEYIGIKTFSLSLSW